MTDPIKIIWKYKNNNKRIQYNTYIFLGNIVPTNIQTILNKITDLNLYDTWISLSKEEYKKLESYYGDLWYTCFFNTYHINSIVSIAKESDTQKTELLDKFGQEWFDKHIKDRKLVEKKIIYNYETIIKDEESRKSTKKTRAMAVPVVEDEANVDYTMTKKLDIDMLNEKQQQRLPSLESDSELSDSDSDSDNVQVGGTIIKELPIHVGGDDVEEEINYDIEPTEVVDDIYDDGESEMHEIIEDERETSKVERDIDSDTVDSEGVESDISEESFEVLPTDEMDIDEIEEMYKESDVVEDKHLSETTHLIQKALDDEKLFEKKNKRMAEFDVSKDNSMYDENLKDIFKKIYIKTQYIYKDDTIKMIKNKICCGMKCNPKFDPELYLAPSRQYLWGEYTFDNKIQKIMLGLKWMRRNELLAIDVEPLNNLRIYEDLRGSLKLLRENIRRYNNRIRRDDEDNNILYDYENYISNNEIYLIDVYNELGVNYSADNETIKNLQDIYLKLYFPKIKNEDVKSIIELLNGNKKTEISKSLIVFETLNNDLVMENEIMDTFEQVKMKEKYQYIFPESYYVTQSVIHLNVHTKEGKINLFRIFNEFTVDEKYPFIQYQTLDGSISYKFHEKEINECVKTKENREVISKWFENAPYGISFKVKIIDKTGINFLAINLTDMGKIQYKTRWKEEDMATIEDIKNTYTYIKDLLTKLNSEKNKITFQMPDDSEFKFAFVNTIQKFVIKDNYMIDHNDLSNFSRYFYPYVALVIEPRKRQSKSNKNTKSKFGTYLRYKRVSNYENQSRIEQRIMYLVRNYEYTEKTITAEIAKQFNITEDKAYEEYRRVITKYPNIKKLRKVLKKMENISKSKPPGIGIDVQGRQIDKYKIRISGARDKVQLQRIITFMNVLMFLYIQTYHEKIPERQILKKKLESLKNIAKRIGKVDNFVDYKKEIKIVKQMAQADKMRIGFKPEKGQSQWTRSCQNSGNDKKRRPQQYNTANIEELLKLGYRFNKKTGIYEKKVYIKDKNGKKKEITLKTIKLSDYDDEGHLTGNEIHYTCNPEENGDHFYVGFLTRSLSPHGDCMPCCFKKDISDTKNNGKLEFYKKCLEQKEPSASENIQKSIGDRLYILQDTNKIQEGRFGFLPKYLDLYFNHLLEKQRKIKHHYLVKTDTGYFFKFGSKQTTYPFLNAVANIFDVDVENIIDKISSVLEKDKNDQIFTSLNNGDIRTQFKTKQEYISLIKNGDIYDYELLNNILSIPNVLVKEGLNIVMFHKKSIIIRKTFEKEKIREDFTVNCQNIEGTDGLKTKDTIFIINENRNYYPIVLVYKKDEASKNLDIVKIFSYKDKKDNIVNHISDFYEKNCNETFMDTVVHKNSAPTAKKMRVILSKYKYDVKYQFIDVRHKCIYLIINNNLIIPVRSSGSLYDVPIIKSLDKYIRNYSETFDQLTKLYETTNKEIPTKPIGVYYESSSKNIIKVNAIMTQTHDLIPISVTELNTKDLDKNELLYENKPLTDKIDRELLKGRSNYIIDDRITSVNLDKYESESYELFRLEFSTFINQPENVSIKSKIEENIIDMSIDKHERSNRIKLIIYKLIDDELYDIFRASVNTQLGGGTKKKLVNIMEKLPDVTNYQISNDRVICEIHDTKEKCNKNIHCSWNNGCRLRVSKKMIIEFVNKIADELVQGNLKAFEIIQFEGYFVSDIIDTNKFTERTGQKIIKSTSNNAKKILNDLLGKNLVQFKIGKKKQAKTFEINYQQLNADHPLLDLKSFYIQKIIEHNLTLIRAYVNGYYWLKNKYSDVENRNLGYYSILQTNLANYFRSLIIDWINDLANAKKITIDLEKYLEIKKTSKDVIKDFVIKLAKDIEIYTNCIVELHVLSIINKIPIIIYNDYNNIEYVFDNGLVYLRSSGESVPEKYDKLIRESVKLRFIFMTHSIIPDEIETIYFKD